MIKNGIEMKKVNYVFSIIIKATILLAIFYVVNMIFLNKDLGTTQYNFARTKRDTMDIVAVGSSHLYCSFHAPLLESEYDVDAYVLGTSAQTMALTYYGVREAIERQHPDVIVLELFYCFFEDELVQSAYTHDFFDEMPWGEVKIEAINALIPEEERMAYRIPFVFYHSRWKELQAKDFSGMASDSRGFWASEQVTSYEPVAVLDESDMLEIPQISKEYLDRIVDLCNEEGITLICYAAPFYSMQDVEGMDMETMQRYYNWLDRYLEQKGIEFVNFFHLLDEIQFDYATDLKDYGHCNTSGATKITRYLAEHYLLEALGLR